MSWEQHVDHSSTEATLTAVMRSRARHWERYLHDRCPDDDCEQHPTPLIDRLDLIDPDEGFWRAVGPHE